jgi:hypothetical protein
MEYVMLMASIIPYAVQNFAGMSGQRDRTA